MAQLQIHRQEGAGESAHIGEGDQMREERPRRPDK